MTTDARERELREELTHYCRFAYQRQLVSGTGGNLSARLPGGDRILITPSAVSLRECTPEDFITVDLAGHKVAGRDDLVPSKEVYLHTAVYAARPDVHAISHLHPPHCILFAVRNQSIPLVTITAEVRLGPTPVVPEAPSGSVRLANLVRDAVVACPEAKLILLERHGVLAIGANLCETIDVADLAEDTARVAHMLSLSTETGVRRVWDISVKDQPGMHFYPGDPELTVTQVRSIAKGDPANLTHLTLGVHTGTHVDAPAHFIDGAPTLEQVGLDRMVGEATVLDLRGRAAIDAAALAPHDLKPGAIVLFKTDNSALWAERGVSARTSPTSPATPPSISSSTASRRSAWTISRSSSSAVRPSRSTRSCSATACSSSRASISARSRRVRTCSPACRSSLQGVDGAPARAVLLR